MLALEPSVQRWRIHNLPPAGIFLSVGIVKSIVFQVASEAPPELAPSNAVQFSPSALHSKTHADRRSWVPFAAAAVGVAQVARKLLFHRNLELQGVAVSHDPITTPRWKYQFDVGLVWVLVLNSRFTGEPVRRRIMPSSK